MSGHPAKSRRGEPSLQVVEFELLAKNRAPLPDTFHGLTDVEQRYRKRYLDLLMNEETRADFIVRSRMVAAIRRQLDADGFVEVETPVLQPRYGGAFAEPFVTHWNYLEQDFYLRIATELYLKRLIVGGLERVYEIGKDFRNEDLLQALERVHDARVVRGLCRLPRHDGADGDPARGGRARGEGDDGHDLPRPRARPEGAVAAARFTDALAEHGLWIRDEAELRAALNERGVDTKPTRTGPSSSTTRSASIIEPTLIQADDRARLPDRDLAVRALDRRRRD